MSNYHSGTYKDEPAWICENITVFGKLGAICPDVGIIQQAATNHKWFMAHIFSKTGTDYGWRVIEMAKVLQCPQGNQEIAPFVPQYKIDYKKDMALPVQLTISPPTEKNAKVENAEQLAQIIKRKIVELVEAKKDMTNVEKHLVYQEVAGMLAAKVALLIEGSIKQL